ncbi:sigma-54-dependent Fis family transcriptional regulator, partial [Vibrio parahaemolyticus]|nr:sigma-54-dependent Fis family transcriptional regulator [Vibrio parahaemolyticus]
MSMPSLFLRIQDPSLKHAIASCQELNKFRLHDIAAADPWIEDFLQLK